jgi:Calcineurin-like phosphoesterase
MPRLAFVGDIHGQLASMYKALMAWMDRTGLKIDGIVQVGDFGVFENGTTWSSMFQRGIPAPMPTWVAMGNHESPKAINLWKSKPDQIKDMHLLPDGEISDVLGVKIGVVWGNYSPISWLNRARVHENRASGQSERIAMHVDADAVDRLLTSNELMDVLVTHESAASTLPTEFKFKKMTPFIKDLLGIAANEDPGGCVGFNDVLKKFKPRHYFFGHLHVFDEGVVGATRYTCLNAIGYPGGPWFQIVEF